MEALPHMSPAPQLLGLDLATNSQLPAQLLVCPPKDGPIRAVIAQQTAMQVRLLVDRINGLQICIVEFYELPWVISTLSPARS